MKRRTFIELGVLGAGLSLAIGGRKWYEYERARPPLSIQLPGQMAGHALRDAATSPPISNYTKASVVIAGSGVAGLSCAWKLASQGRSDFIVITGPEPFGNANEYTPSKQPSPIIAPTGAHYLPLPGIELKYMRELLWDLGIILDNPYGEFPEYDERALIMAPHERLLRQGIWEENLLPMTGISQQDIQQHQRFLEELSRFRSLKGQDGKRVFAIPVAWSSTDDTWQRLDTITFKTWLLQQGYTSESLLWYTDYCMRDDYGAGSDTVSAWAGLHYYCSRNGQGKNAGPESQLTWPNGLTHLMHGMYQRICHYVGHTNWWQPGTVVSAKITDSGTTKLQWKAHSALESITQTEAQTVISAMPLHVARYVFKDAEISKAVASRPHAPWLVSNFLMNGYPQEHPGENLAWDNVVFGSNSLGYVVSTHQDIRFSKPVPTCFTAYHALTHLDPKEMRQWLLQASPYDLQSIAQSDLLAAYDSSLWKYVESIDITVRGHAMAIPTPGFLHHPELKNLQQAQGKLLFAHSDLSGYSVFEEAAWWGIQAAEKLL